MYTSRITSIEPNGSWTGKFGIMNAYKVELANGHLLNFNAKGELVYIGIGFDGRAYEATLRRKSTHAKFMLGEQLAGRQYVKITHSGLNKFDSEILEAELLKEYRDNNNGENPKFNISNGRAI